MRSLFLCSCFLASACSTDVVHLKLLPEPSAPTGVIGTGGFQSVSIRWDASPFEEQVNEYVVAGASTEWTVWQETLPGAFLASSGTTSFERTGLVNESTYYVAVAARNRRAQGSFSTRVAVPVPGWVSPALVGHAEGEDSRGIAVDPTSGAVYVGGETFGPFPGEAEGGDCDAWIGRLAANRKVEWIDQFGSPSCDQTHDIAVDPTGNVIVIGLAGGDLGGGSGSTFIAKYDGTGQRQWIRQVSNASALAVATDAQGNVYVAGSTNIGLDGNTLGGGSDLFFQKYDADGTRLYTRQRGGTGNEGANDIAIAESGEIYLTGSCSAAYDSQIHAGGAQDTTVLKFDASGVHSWTRILGTAASEAGVYAAVDEFGSLFVGGITSGAFSGEANAGSNDVFVLKFDPGGFADWWDQFGSTAGDSIGGIAARNGKILVSGSTLGMIGPEGSAGGSDLFVRAYDRLGVVQWTKQLGSGAGDYGGAMSHGPDGTFFMTGLVGNGFMGSTTNGPGDVAVVKFSPDGEIR